MKIVSLRFKNLNSLAGEWQIDFTRQEFETDGIFLISGPTGSGKTTILDAICLALYGRTPRLANFSANSNEIMHSSSNDCMAEVTFETSTGRYRSMWAQKRTGPRAKIPFNAAIYKLENADTENCLGSTLSFLREETPKIIGMDFEQFTRSMLLAQGNFSAFLQSVPNERAKILEQITGTEIYSRISKKIYRLAGEKADAIKLKMAEMQGIAVLTEEQERELRAEYKKCANLEKELDERCAVQANAIDWLRKIRLLSAELDNLRSEEKAAEKENSAFAQNREVISRATRAEAVAPLWDAYKSVRARYDKTYNDFADQDGKLPGFEDARDRADKLAREARAKKENAGSLYNEAMLKWEGARNLDKIIERQQGQLREENAALVREKDKYQEMLRRKDEIGIQLKDASARFEALSAWLAQHDQAENLDGVIAALEQKLAGLEKCRQNGREKKAALEKASAARTEKSATLDALRLKIANMRKNRQAADAKSQNAASELEDLLAGKTLEQLRARRDELATERNRLILLGSKNVEDLRAGLVDGEACPVCGAVHHPFAKGNIPQTAEVDGQIRAVNDIIEKALEQERQINDQQKAADKIAYAILGEENKENLLTAELAICEENIGQLECECRKIGTEFGTIENECFAMIGDLGIGRETGLERALDLLRAKNVEIRNKRKEKIENETVAARLTERLEAENNALKTHEARILEIRQVLARLEKDISEQINQREMKYGAISEAEVKKIGDAAAKASNEEDAAVKKLESAVSAFAACQSQLELLRGQLTEQKAELGEKARLFKDALAEQGFADETAFLAASLSKTELEALRAQEKRLETRLIEIGGALKDKASSLEIEKARNLTPETLETMEARQKADQEARERNIGNKGQLELKIRQNEEAKAVRGEREELLERMKKDYDVYKELNDLIGSAEGDKFKRFAQGLTFEILIAHANQQLAKMNDRYLLLMDKSSPLELNIIDNYQGGEIRSIKNLSGGETFIVSLALALGLANMSSKKTAVDSLFLDEGFGTLDENTLETALETLESLKREGKLIGIISHVPALRERLSTRLDVIPAGGGKSRIEGPGCARL